MRLASAVYTRDCRKALLSLSKIEEVRVRSFTEFTKATNAYKALMSGPRKNRIFCPLF